jgi:hypothetical protein
MNSTEPDLAQGWHGARYSQGQALRAPAAALTSAVRRARQWCKAGTEERPRPNKRTDPERTGQAHYAAMALPVSTQLLLLLRRSNAPAVKGGL